VIIFVALGRTARFVRHALRQARAANPATAIVLVHDGLLAGWGRFASRALVDLCDVREFSNDTRLRTFVRRPDPRRWFRNGFWRHTTSRFFVLRAFMEHARQDSATHLENDVLVYAPLAELTDWSPVSGCELSTVFESAGRAIPAIVHVGARHSLDAFTDFVLEEPEALETDDMTRMAAFRRARPDLVADLPTLPPPDAQRPDRTLSLFDRALPPIALPSGDWLFDGARFGQYLGGIDPRNSSRWIERWMRRQRGDLRHPHGYINESCTDDPSRYGYRVTSPRGLSAPAVVSGERTFPLATLHVHSKKLGRFTSAALDVPSGRSRS
jgi:hypothetical protein